MHRLAREADARRQRVQTPGPGSKREWSARAEGARRQLEILAEARPRAPRRSATSLPAGRRRSPPSAMRCSRSSRTRSRPGTAGRCAGEAENATGEAERRLKAGRNPSSAPRARTACAEEATVGQAEQGLHELAQRIRERLDCAPEDVLPLAELDPSEPLPDVGQLVLVTRQGNADSLESNVRLRGSQHENKNYGRQG